MNFFLLWKHSLSISGILNFVQTTRICMERHRALSFVDAFRIDLSVWHASFSPYRVTMLTFVLHISLYCTRLVCNILNWNYSPWVVLSEHYSLWVILKEHYSLWVVLSEHYSQWVVFAVRSLRSYLLLTFFMCINNFSPLYVN